MVNRAGAAFWKCDSSLIVDVTFDTLWHIELSMSTQKVDPAF
jgi:hypothetical protein